MNNQTVPAEVRFLCLLAKRLHEYGTAAHRLEGAISAAATQLGLKCDVLSSPTSLLLAFRYPRDAEEPQLIPTQLIRLNPGEIDLGRLYAADAIAEDVAAKRTDLRTGFEQLRDLNLSPTWPGLAGNLFAWGLTGASLTALLGSGWFDIAIAFGLGTLAGMFALRWGRRWQEAGSFEAILAFLITLLAYLIATLVGAAAVPNIVVGALIILMPGLGLTVAITELSTGHWASGSARFFGATIILAKLALGVVLATQLALALGMANGDASPTALPPVIIGLAVIAAGIAFAILFRARPADYWAVVSAAVISFAINRFAAFQVGPELGVFLAALTVAALSNAYGRFLSRPASIVRFPGIILLVPGSLGYRAISLVFSHNLDDGLDAAISVGVVLASLVGGLLIGNTLVPPRRNL